MLFEIFGVTTLGRSLFQRSGRTRACIAIMEHVENWTTILQARRLRKYIVSLSYTPGYPNEVAHDEFSDRSVCSQHGQRNIFVKLFD